jgi:hypothetical protein
MAQTFAQKAILLGLQSLVITFSTAIASSGLTAQEAASS